MKDLKIEMVPVNALVEDPVNARKHGPENMKAIRDSLESHGQVEPLVVQRARMRVIGGNGRLAAMKALGWKEAGVVFVDVSDAKAVAMGIALNRAGELAEWDFTRLADSLASLDTGEFDVSAFTGFDEKELERIASWTPENFHPTEESEQPRLDVKTPTKCPKCGHEFTP